MKFTLESTSRANLVRAYTESEIRVGEHTVRTSCIVTADQLITNWEPAVFAQLSPQHLQAVLAVEPEVVLLGTGPRQRFPSADVRAVFAERGVGLEVMDLGAACRTFNVLVQEKRRVAAMLFLA